MEKIKKKIIITGNLGYFGSVLTDYLIKKNYEIVGVDLGWFKDDLVVKNKKLKFEQHIKSFSSISQKEISDADCIVHLAGVSNDPIGNEFKKITQKINVVETKKLIDKVSKFKDITFIFASSCSVYGFAENNYKTEKSKTAPLTEYSKSKVIIEKYLKKKKIKSVVLRYATACGVSPRLRLDLVLNDFVTNALKKNEIEILSDGKPKRPLIDVLDMCKSINYAIEGRLSKNNKMQIYNVGSTKNNYSILQIAKKVKYNFKKIFDKKISIKVNKIHSKDKRSYLVNFKKYENTLKFNLKSKSIDQSIQELAKSINKNSKINKNFRNGNFIRLNKLRKIL
tara:strand:+ start:8632 stop:9645 length:1014 start_codon:yes stop_codon:yes gene_type:complete